MLRHVLAVALGVGGFSAGVAVLWAFGSIYCYFTRVPYEGSPDFGDRILAGAGVIIITAACLGMAWLLGMFLLPFFVSEPV